MWSEVPGFLLVCSSSGCGNHALPGVHGIKTSRQLLAIHVTALHTNSHAVQAANMVTSCIG